MSKTKTSASPKLKWWPTPQDYNEAVQHLLSNTQDSALQSGQLHTDALGLPRPVTGAFASVYRVGASPNDFALRCFLRNIEDQQQRYSVISNFIQSDDLPYTVTFDFMSEGIRVNNTWFPALKMEWVEGLTLDAYIYKHLDDKTAIANLADKFFIMCQDLRVAGIAHGDLQHGNIIITDDKELRLVDYDGLFVPAMESLTSNELGHRNFQHPARNENHFGVYLDNFSAWVIYTCLRAIALDPAVYKRCGGGDDCLLFRRTDFVEPIFSPAFEILEKHRDHEVRDLARFVRSLLQIDPALVPPLSRDVPAVEHLPPLAGKIAKAAAHAQLKPGAALPGWMIAGSTSTKGEPDFNWNEILAKSKVHKTSNAISPMNAGLEPEFESRTRVPRRIYWQGSFIESPFVLQVAALFNPLLWFIILSFVHGFIVIPIVTLVCLFFGFLVILLETAIWQRTFKELWLLMFGTPTVARVTAAGPDFYGNHEVTCEFEAYGKKHLMNQRVTAAQSYSVSVGDNLTVLFHPQDPFQGHLIYKFASYGLTPGPSIFQELRTWRDNVMHAVSKPFHLALTASIRFVRGLKPHIVPNPVPVPEGALNSPAPRNTRFDDKCGKMAPELMLILSFVNPLVLMAVIAWSLVCTGDRASLIPAINSTICAFALQVYLGFKSRYDKHLITNGTAVQGQITRKESGRFSMNEKYAVEYVFRAVDGRVFKRRMEVSNEALWNQLKEHDHVTVLYYDGPFGTESTIYKFSCYKAINKT